MALTAIEVKTAKRLINLSNYPMAAVYIFWFSPTARNIGGWIIVFQASAKHWLLAFIQT